MQSEQKSFVVLGTRHDLQTAPVSLFPDFVAALCREFRVDFIGEEANGLEWTHAKRVSALVGADWANVDLTLAERESMGLTDTWDATLSCDDRFLRDSKRLFLGPMEERERAWVARLTNRTRASGLLICGIVHTLSVSSKLADTGHRVLPHYYMPEEKEAQMVVIAHVPMTQDECRSLASRLHAMTVEEVWDIVLRMPTNAEEHTETLSNGNILTLRKK